MKNIILSIAIAAITMTACNSSGSKSADESTLSVSDVTNTSSIVEIVSVYLHLKNALAEDNSAEAAVSGTSLEAAFKNFDKTALNETQKKTYEDVEDDAREHAEHIGSNSGNIAHQREHFEMLSKDIYDLVKAFGGGQVLFYTFCPMYNDGKGAYWISETKEIKNPYFGKEMPDCGAVKEEIQ